MSLQIKKDRKYSDINLLFTSHPVTGDVVKHIDANAVKASVKNLILTRNYDRLFHPEIGCQVYSLLFENMDMITLQAMRRTIADTISIFEPRAEIQVIDVYPSPEENAVHISVSFNVINMTELLTVDVVLERTR